jgi:hypothetical protein
MEKDDYPDYLDTLYNDDEKRTIEKSIEYLTPNDYEKHNEDDGIKYEDKKVTPKIYDIVKLNPKNF